MTDVRVPPEAGSPRVETEVWGRSPGLGSGVSVAHCAPAELTAWLLLGGTEWPQPETPWQDQEEGVPSGLEGVPRETKPAPELWQGCPCPPCFVLSVPPKFQREKGLTWVPSVMEPGLLSPQLEGSSVQRPVGAPMGGACGEPMGSLWESLWGSLGGNLWGSLWGTYRGA